mgnify:CR=1 FL=1
MKTAFIVYPWDYSRIAAPWTIGNNLTDFFHKNGWPVKNFDWRDTLEIFPHSEDDIILGHPHNNDNMIFNKSYLNFKHRYAIMPFNNSEPGLYSRIAKNCDKFFGICGKPWHDKLHKISNAVRLDIAIDHDKFPRIKKDFNPPGRRKAIYIGCGLPCKNPEFLGQIAQRVELTHVGHDTIRGANNIGYVQDIRSIFSFIAEHDFVIAASRYDANPTYVLECMSLGLIPICNEESGYPREDCIRILLDDIKIFEITMRQMQMRDDLKKLQDYFCMKAKFYTWERFNSTIEQNVMSVN